MVFQIPKEPIFFPSPYHGNPTGLFCIGGDLNPERIKLAYRHGIFPWFSFKRKEPQWFCPMNRFVIFPSEVHVSHSLRNLMNKNKYRVTIDEDFEGVIRGCSTAQNRNKEIGAWLGEEVIEIYTDLFAQGWTSSVEVWDMDGRLVGGLYGGKYNGCFIGESMFSLVPQASKLALVFLARRMEESGWKMIDTQIHTPHLRSMGGRYIPYDDYMRILEL